MSVELHGGRYIESDEEEGFGSRLRQVLRKSWSKGGRGSNELEEEGLGP